MTESVFWAEVDRYLVRYGGSFVPAVVERAQGCFVYDAQCRAILDFTSGQMSAVLGHSHPDIVETVQRSAATLAHATPRIGHLDPTLDHATIVDRLLDWVAFTPWHNITGAPAISLPLATTADGLPQGMMFGAAPGQEAVLIELAYELEQAAPFARIHQ